MLLVRCLYARLVWRLTVAFVEIPQKVCHDISAVWLLLPLPTFNTYTLCQLSLSFSTTRSDMFVLWDQIDSLYSQYTRWKTFSWPLCKYIVSPTHQWWCSISFNSIHGIGMFHNPRTVTTEFCSFQQLRSGHDRICMEGNSSSCGLSHGLGNSATLPQQEWGKSATKCTV